MRYEWDEAKSRRNKQKHHGISFELAALVFEDQHCLVFVHVYREDRGGEEIVRIISARAAEKHEVRRYQEQAVD